MARKMLKSKLEEIGRKTLERSFNLFEGSGVGKIPGVFRMFLYLKSIFFKSAIVDGQILYLGNSGPKTSWELYYEGVTEPHVTALFCSLIKEGMTVIDVGAFVGYYTLLAAKRVGDNGKVFAFEPAPSPFKLLLKNIEINGWGNIKPFQLAVSDKSEKRKFNIKALSGSSFAITKNIVDTITVNTISLDSFLQTDPDMVKIDVEGGVRSA